MSTEINNNIWKKIKNRVSAWNLRLRTRAQYQSAPLIIKRDQHHISRNMISKNALKVLYRLRGEGYDAYLVGGGVRDLLLGHEPKDFDIVTNATPEQIKQCFRNCRLIGRRFRLAHIHFQDEIIEVATFRATIETKEQQHLQSDNGMLLRDNVYGDIQQDAWRRDFTINALYYNIADFTVRDYVGGMHDLKCNQIRMIGDPKERYQEDPVRILRAVRLSCKLGMQIHPDTEQPIHAMAHLLKDVASGRMFEEFKKMFLSGIACEVFAKLKHYGLLEYVLPQTSVALDHAHYTTQYDFIHLSLKNTDQRIQEDRPVTIGFLIATMLWYPVLELTQQYHDQGLPKLTAFEKASRKVIAQHTSVMSLPRYVNSNINEIYHLQMRLNQTHSPKALRTVENPRFKAAYDFLLLRADAGENVKPLATWWTTFFEADPHQRKQLIHAPREGGSGKRQRGPRRSRKKNHSPTHHQIHAGDNKS